MQLLAVVLGRVFGWVLSGLVFKLVTSFGVGVVVFWGLGELFTSTLSEIQSMTASLPTAMAQLMAVLRIDDAIQTIFSAISIRLSLKSFGLGGIGSVFFKGQSIGAP
jgi:Protein of unknown function (DUF2523)